MSHSHHHHHHHSPKSQMGSLKLILFVSALYMIFEVVGGLVSGSLALIADAGHMLIDSLSVGLSIFALWISQRPANAKRTYGYHRAEILAALLNGSALIVVSLWIFYEAWSRFQSPDPIKGELMLGVATGGLLVNLFSLFILKKHSDHSLNMRGVWLHAMADLLGSVSAIIASILVWRFNWLWADPAVSCAIGILVLHGAWKLVTECVDVLLESVPKGLDIEQIRSSLRSVEGVEEVHDLHVWVVKSGTYALSVHVKITDANEQARLLTELNELIEEKFLIHHSTIQLECQGFEHTSAHFKDCNLANPKKSSHQ